MPAVTFIDSLPLFVSVDEHKNLVGSTPASYSDIPPVLRHQEENVSVTLDPPLPSFTLDDAARGTLYVIESVLVFMSATGRGFRVEYPSITLHAISRSDAGPSIYCQLDESVSAVDGAQPAPEEVANEDSAMRELSILPQNANSLEPIFESLSLCASLHPDPSMDIDDEDDDSAFLDAENDPSAFETFAGAEGEELSEVGRAALEHLESIIYNPFEVRNGNAERESDAQESSHVNGVNGTHEEASDEHS